MGKIKICAVITQMCDMFFNTMFACMCKSPRLFKKSTLNRSGYTVNAK